MRINRAGTAVWKAFGTSPPHRETTRRNHENAAEEPYHAPAEHHGVLPVLLPAKRDLHIPRSRSYDSRIGNKFGGYDYHFDNDTIFHHPNGHIYPDTGYRQGPHYNVKLPGGVKMHYYYEIK